MRVLQYGMSDNRGGIEVVTMNVYRNIIKNDIKFDFLICGEKIAFENEIKDLGGKIFKITRRRKNPIKHYLDYIRLFMNIRGKYDAIHCSCCTLYSITPIILAKLFGIKCIILHSRNSNYNSNKWRLKIAHRLNCLLADKLATEFLACSELAAKFMFSKKRYDSGRYNIFRNPVLLEGFYFNENIRNKMRKQLKVSSSFLLGHVGAFLPVKNHSFILKVFKELSDIGIDCRLILIGDGAKEFKDSIEKQARELAIEGKMIFTGSVSNVNEYMQAMDGFILPSFYEGLPNTLIEAQAAGLKSFVSDCITNEAAVVPGMVERLSINESAYRWAEKIYEYALNSAKDTERKIEKNLFNEFSMESCMYEYKKLYQCNEDSNE